MGASAATAPAGRPPPASTPAPPRLASRWPRLRSGADTGAAGVVARYAVIGIPLVLGLLAWRGASYWEYSEGVYALTARMILGGAGLYGEVVAAQPPLLFLAGAGVLAMHDSLEALRATLALPLLATGLLVALAVWRLTASRLAAVSGGLAALVAPWTLHEGTLLMPEAFAAPLLMGAALLASSPAQARWAGALAALAASVKLAFVLPLLALGLASGRRRAYAAGAAVALVLLWGAFFLAYGRPLLDNVFAAQLQSGRQAARHVAGLWLQAAWNLGPLVLLAALGLPLRRRARDPRLLRSTAVLAAGATALVLTLTKHGSYLNVLAVAEPPLVVLAACSAWWVLGPCAQREPGAPEHPPWEFVARARAPALARGAAVLAAALLLAESASLLLSPAQPAIFARPLSDASHGRALSSEGVRATARTDAGCPVWTPSRPNPFFAFVAGRPMPGGQPDRFILRRARVHAAVRRRALASPAPSAACGPPGAGRLARATVR